MSLEVNYSCGTCGLKIVDNVIYPDGKGLNNCVVEKKIWHECADGYIVPLQSLVEKATKPIVLIKEKVHEPKQKANHK